MTIIPIKELKDTSKISDMVANSDGPIYITKNGYGQMVIMSTSSFERCLEEKVLEGRRLERQQLEYEYDLAAVREGIADMEAGRGRDAFELLDELEERNVVQDRRA